MSFPDSDVLQGISRLLAENADIFSQKGAVGEAARHTQTSECLRTEASRRCTPVDPEL